MSLLKFVNRLKRIDNLLTRECTGNADEFANKVGISRSMLMDNLREMRELGAHIEYCPRRKSYFYTSNFDLVIGNDSKRKALGGRSSSEKIYSWLKSNERSDSQTFNTAGIYFK